ncbi:gluconokinase [Paenibacillus sp. URB8-2]|uniref:gluconokinase n=1 Tax=Paenibacillus sp. URB8-2 TaxID=2741301 RepID=UPI0015C2B10C|nr:gluconokinase [Paenibacillus sp. URB8-2]BCG61408.1 gluconate kinase [Paenibacillus sp. URB8-2]
MGLFVGLDIGTTSAKVFLYERHGKIRGQGKAAYTLLVPEPGRAEQRPEEIMNAVAEAFRRAMINGGVKPEDIEAVGVSAGMHSLMAVDKDGMPLTPLLTWADNRSVPQLAELKRSGAAEELYALTGTPAHPMSPLGKLLWWKENKPELFETAARFISIKEYLLHRCFGLYALDVSTAAATGLLHISGRGWCEKALQLAGIGKERLGEIVPVTEVLRGMKPEMAEAFGLLPHTPWVVGASDGALANIGSGAASLGNTAVTIGSSGSVRRFVSNPLTDPQGRTFCYAFGEDRWLIGGPTNNGGIALRWFKEQFMNGVLPGPEIRDAIRAQPERRQRRGRQHVVIDPSKPGHSSLDDLITLAMSVPAGADGVLFLPYLSGERAPYWNPDARGVFAGAGLHHGRQHFVRAVLEGVLFAVNDVTETLSGLAGPPERMLASGGFASSAVWTGLLSDMTGLRIDVPRSYEASAYGAALLAMFATGALDSLDQADARVGILRSHAPNEENRAVYEKLYPLFKDVYRRLEPVFPELVSMQGRL